MGKNLPVYAKENGRNTGREINDIRSLIKPNLFMNSENKQPDLEIWGGLECTINRVDDNYFNQLAYSGHNARKDDISHFANLGIRKIRYPILWEQHQPKATRPINWAAAEAKLLQLKQRKIEPIAGLLHHGSGPAFTNLLDPEFPEKFAKYALKVASKFPWINNYTPINEPLTTARFSGLYGLWYPHLRDDLSFLKILINQCKASLMAMQAIRTINEQAVWIQTEDLGKTHATPLLQYQADFENQRRWLAFDLMMGRVNSGHPLWDYILWAGVNPQDLAFFEENACSPDILGFNYYVTSERYLDESIGNYPEHNHGSNSRHCYADVEAVRYRPEGLSGIKNLLKEAWNHFRKPMAITEVHLHCSRDEQLRWFKEIWQEAKDLNTEGIPLWAITAWALLGSFGWNQLLTSGKGDYEPGVFDISNGSLRPTALSKLISGLSVGKTFDHPVLNAAGWWNKPYAGESFNKENIRQKASLKSIIIIGKTGTLGQAFARICNHRALAYQLLGRHELDITKTANIEQMIQLYKPWAIINTAGYVKVDAAEYDPENCFLSNTEGARNLAGICAKYQIPLLSFSSDLVFGGDKSSPYLESDITAPLNIYGRSKALAEKQILLAHPGALVIRTSSFFGPWDEANFASHVLRSLNLKQSVFAANDLLISPTYVPELANTCLDLLIDQEQGIWHLANEGELSWADFAIEIAQRAGYGRQQIIALPAEELGLKAKRPKYSVLRSERGANLSALDRAIQHFFGQKEIKSKSY
ncbi:MAG: family 1 glycosylhydrolase [Sphingobacteriaceae bacterium]